MDKFVVRRTRAKKRWVKPRLVQFVAQVVCLVTHHSWCQWRIETEDWFREVDEPEAHAWRACRECGRIERVVARG